MIAGLLVVALSLVCQDVTPELRERVERGLAAKARGDWDGAVREFERVVELRPDLAAAHVNLGSAYLSKRDYARAAAALRKAVSIDDGLVGAQQMLGAALLAQGAAAEAVPHLEKAGANDLLGIALLEAGRARDAVEKLEAALVARPGDPDLLYYLSQAHGRLSKQAFDVLSSQARAAAGAGEGAGAVVRREQMLGEAMAAAGNREAAEKHFRAALAKRPDLRGVHLVLGQLYWEAGDFARAEVEFRAEVAMVPASAVAAYQLGRVLLQKGDAKGAVSELERANGLRAGMPETEFELGKALAANGDLAGAERLLRKVLEAEGRSALAEGAHLQLSQVYRRLGRVADAERELAALRALRGAGR